MDRRSLLGGSAVALVSVTGCVDRLQSGFFLNHLFLAKLGGLGDDGGDVVEIIVEMGDEIVHTSTHGRPIEQPSENEPLLVSDEFPDERNEIHLTVTSGDIIYENTYDTNIFEDHDGYCIDLVIYLQGDAISSARFGPPYEC